MVWETGYNLNGGRYVIERQLGEGGFGITYLVKDSENKLFVVKTLKDERLRSSKIAQLREEFKDEALKLFQCQHPNIIKIKSVFDEHVDDSIYKGRLPCIVMEYIQGENLEQLVNNSQDFLKESEALKYICQIAEALKVIHKIGLLHRDVKPQNIMVRANTSEAVLIDFGIARGFIPDNTISHTQLFTDNYAPPEQSARTRLRWGPFIDIYALAATLYYLLTKTEPEPSCARLLPAIESEFKAPKIINSNISDRVNHAIMRGMTLDSNQRPPTVETWLELLNSKADSPVITSESLSQPKEEFTINEREQQVKIEENLVSEYSRISVNLTSDEVRKIFNNLPFHKKEVLDAILSGFTEEKILKLLNINHSSLQSILEQLSEDFHITSSEKAELIGEAVNNFSLLIAFFEKHLPEFILQKKINIAEVVDNRFNHKKQVDNKSEEAGGDNPNQPEASLVNPSSPNLVNDNGYAIATGAKTIKILIITANPVDTNRLRLDEEVRQITEVLRNSRKGIHFIVEELWAVRFRDLRQAMLNFEPNIIHFCGHGAAEGLIFEDDSGNLKLISPEALSRLFELFKEHIFCIVFNACYSENQAQSITKHINYIVGMSKAITDRTAIYFATAFYEAIANGRSIEFAFEIGCNSIEAEGMPENLTPILLKSSFSDLIPLDLKLNQLSINSKSQNSTETKLPLILIFAANPSNTTKLRTDEEVREIKRELRSVRKSSFFVESRWATRLSDFHKAMLELKPQIVHFSGHGAGEDGIVFENEQGQPQLVKHEALARQFKLYANYVNCVVINACYSEIQAKAISEHINYVIGMQQAIGDRAAIDFAIGFYRALAHDFSVEYAFELGRREIEISGNNVDYLTPSLYSKKEKIVTTTQEILDDIQQPNNTQVKQQLSRKEVVKVQRNLEGKESERIRSHQEWEVYQVAFDTALKIFEVSKKYANEGCDSLICKIQMSSRSVCTNLAEAWKKRRDKNALIAKLNDCEREVMNVQVLIEFAVKCNYLDADISQDFCEVYNKILGSLENMINNPGGK